MLLHRELLLTMFYAINSSPLLITKKVFMPTIILSSCQQCAVPLKTHDTFDKCQRPVFSLNVSQHMHKITNL